MVIYCTKCWKDNPAGSQVCQRCGARLEGDETSYVTKLIHALSHPEPLTVERAAWILGEIRTAEAVEPLIRLLQTNTDKAALESAIEALGKIGDYRAVEALSHMVTSSFLRVRLAVVGSLRKIGGEQALIGLRKALSDPSYSVSSSARAAIDALGLRDSMNQVADSFGEEVTYER
jgi:HEAT repeat protein